MALTLRWTDATTLPVEAGTLRPEALAGLSAAEVARLELPLGNTRVEAGALFTIEGDPSDGRLVFEGNLARVRAIGSGMASGRITVRGDVGPRAGLGMAGGELTIEGSAGVYAGAEMSGGTLRIGGDAETGLGSALPGSRLGMREGIILVGGSVGEDVGLAMRRGLIAIAGRAGRGLGRALVAGTIVALGPVDEFAGMAMKRGTIALLGLERPDEPPLLPTFAPSGRDRPPFLTIYLKALLGLGFPVPDAVFAGSLARYNGDQADRGQGEVLVWG